VYIYESEEFVKFSRGRNSFDDAFPRVPLPTTMASVLPYTYYSCSCVDTTSSSATVGVGEVDEEGGTFNPKSQRANFSLFPIEHLLYCTECHQVRCPRCITEEVVCWYCPGCLFEVASSAVRSEGNRYFNRLLLGYQIANIQPQMQ
jgi:hypothetical protein